MDDKNEPLPWDYFLTNYERDLVLLSIEDMMRKYPEISREQLESDFLEAQGSQLSFESRHRQN